MISYLIWFVSSAVGTCLFSFMMHAPRRAILPNSILAGTAYTVFMLVSNQLHSEPMAYFLATMLAAVGSELLATLGKMPAMIFLFPSVIPMVPGIGIYRTMLYLIQKKYEAFLDTGTQTLIALGAMAVAIALTNEIARRVHSSVRQRTQFARKQEGEHHL